MIVRDCVHSRTCLYVVGLLVDGCACSCVCVCLRMFVYDCVCVVGSGLFLYVCVCLRLFVYACVSLCMCVHARMCLCR